MTSCAGIGSVSARIRRCAPGTTALAIRRSDRSALRRTFRMLAEHYAGRPVTSRSRADSTARRSRPSPASTGWTLRAVTFALPQSRAETGPGTDLFFARRVASHLGIERIEVLARSGRGPRAPRRQCWCTDRTIATSTCTAGWSTRRSARRSRPCIPGPRPVVLSGDVMNELLADYTPIQFRGLSTSGFPCSTAAGSDDSSSVASTPATAVGILPHRFGWRLSSLCVDCALEYAALPVDLACGRAPSPRRASRDGRAHSPVRARATQVRAQVAVEGEPGGTFALLVNRGIDQKYLAQRSRETPRDRSARGQETSREPGTTASAQSFPKPASAFWHEREGAVRRMKHLRKQVASLERSSGAAAFIRHRGRRGDHAPGWPRASRPSSASARGGDDRRSPLLRGDQPLGEAGYVDSSAAVELIPDSAEATFEVVVPDEVLFDPDFPTSVNGIARIIRALLRIPCGCGRSSFRRILRPVQRRREVEMAESLRDPQRDPPAPACRPQGYADPVGTGDVPGAENHCPARVAPPPLGHEPSRVEPAQDLRQAADVSFRARARETSSSPDHRRHPSRPPGRPAYRVPSRTRLEQPDAGAAAAAWAEDEAAGGRDLRRSRAWRRSASLR